MKNKKLAGIVMTGALTLGLMGGVVPTYAAGNGGNHALKHGSVQHVETQKKSEKTKSGKVQQLDAATQVKVQEIIDTAKSKLTDLGITLPTKPEKVDPFANLSDELKTQVQTIMDQVKAGTLTHEEANTKLINLGIKLPAKPDKANPFANLSDELKAQVKAIMDQEIAGTLTHEEAQTKITALGVTLPDKHENVDPFAHLDADTKAQAEAIISDAQAQLQALGVNGKFPILH